MNRRRISAAVAALICLCMLRIGSAQAISVDLTVRNDAPAAFVDGHVTSGVPLPPGTPSNTQFALFYSGAEVPLQSHFIFGVKTPWLLLDFQVAGTLDTAATRIYQLVSQAPTVTPPVALSYSTLGNAIIVNTGPLQVRIDPTAFNLFEEV